MSWTKEHLKSQTDEQLEQILSSAEHNFYEPLRPSDDAWDTLQGIRDEIVRRWRESIRK